MSNSVGRISLTSPETGFIMTTSEKDLLNFLYRLYQADIPERFRSIKFLIYYLYLKKKEDFLCTAMLGADRHHLETGRNQDTLFP